MFSETRYALNSDMRVAYRASREGPRDIVSVPNWFTCCEVLPELPSFQGWSCRTWHRERARRAKASVDTLLAAVGEGPA